MSTLQWNTEPSVQRPWLLFLLINLLLIASPSTSASELAIKNGGATVISFSDKELSELPQSTINTELPWLEGQNTFTGVTFEALFAASNTPLPNVITLIAYNDYKVSIKLQDIQGYQPIIANRKNGKRMLVRDKGPFWVIFPLSEHPEINNIDYHAMMIWQLKEIRY
jgi:hypothetical protein